MKKIIIILTSTIMIFIAIVYYGYYVIDHEGVGYSGIKFVISGGYYVDCQHGGLIKKTPPNFPYQKIKSGKYEIDVSRIGPSYRDDFYRHFKHGLKFLYLDTGLSNGDFVGSDMFYSDIMLDNEKFVVFASNVSNEILLIDVYTVGDFNPNDHSIEKVRRSCSLPQ